MPTPDGQPPHEGACHSREAAEQQIRERDARDEREQRDGDRPGAIAHSLDDQARAVPVCEGKRDAHDKPRQGRQNGCRSEQPMYDDKITLPLLGSVSVVAVETGASDECRWLHS